MRIDSHQHVFWWGRDDAGLVADMDEQGIDLAWLLSWEIPPAEDNASYHGVLNPIHFRPDGTHAGIPLIDLIRTKNRYPDRFIVGYCPHPLYGNAPALFESAYKIHHVRVCGEWKFRVPFDDPRCLNLYRKAGELGCPVVLHLDAPYLLNKETNEMTYQPQWYGGTIDNLERALKACPKTIFLGHAPGFWRYISGDAEGEPTSYPTGPVVAGGRVHQLLDAYPNLMCDLSAGSGRNALSRDPEHAKKFINQYAERLTFARDFYGGELHEFLQTLGLSAGQQELIYQKNAQKLVHLD
jgi:predicted TIM-barrel fold metal-dependent hydrolase